jgi:hypothetical protein
MAKVLIENRIKTLEKGKELSETEGSKFLYVRKSFDGLVAGYAYRVRLVTPDIILVCPAKITDEDISVTNEDCEKTEYWIKIGF